jgi:hypothetical protein
MKLQDLKDSMSKELWGSTVAVVIPSGLCIKCKEPALEKCYSAMGRREYRISGLCEQCFDEITKE